MIIEYHENQGQFHFSTKENLIARRLGWTIISEADIDDEDCIDFTFTIRKKYGNDLNNTIKATIDQVKEEFEEWFISKIVLIV